MNWRDYHEATKHSIESLMRARRVLDWANMQSGDQRLAAAALSLGQDLAGKACVAFFLNLTPEEGQVVYHFAIGYPIPDPRISASRDRQGITR